MDLSGRDSRENTESLYELLDLFADLHMISHLLPLLIFEKLLRDFTGILVGVLLPSLSYGKPGNLY